MTSNDDTMLSKTITFLRFPLIVAVVLIHTQPHDVTINGTLLASEEQFPIYALLWHIVSDELARIAVPLFFFISGFLFFYHTDFSLRAYGQKLKTRARTLLVPYLFWNIMVLFLYFLTQQFLSSMTSGKNKLITDYGWMDWVNIFWSHYDGQPISVPFWFIRDLMVVILLSPILHVFIRRCKVFSVLILGVLWFFGLWMEVPGFSSTAFFFFSFGAWFSINRRNFTVDFLPMRWNAAFLYLALVVLSTWVWRNNLMDTDYIHKTGIVVGLIAIVSWTARGVSTDRLPVSKFLAGSSFFVYAYHGMPLALLVKYWVKLLAPMNEWTMIAGYLCASVSIVGIGVGGYALVRRYFPTLTALVTGGR